MSRETGFAPFELLFGVKMNLLQNTNLTELIQDAIEISFDEKRCEIREESRRQPEKIAVENVRNFNKKRKVAHNYCAGDLVAIKRTQFGGTKISKGFFGTFSVLHS
jgi:hypothetical protein